MGSGGGIEPARDPGRHGLAAECRAVLTEEELLVVADLRAV